MVKIKCRTNDNGNSNGNGHSNGYAKGNGHGHAKGNGHGHGNKSGSHLYYVNDNTSCHAYCSESFSHESSNVTFTVKQSLNLTLQFRPFAAMTNSRTF